MRMLVIGGSGLLGSYLLREGRRLGHEMTGTYRSYPVQGLVHCDLADADETEALLGNTAPEVVIHAAGWPHVDGCERDPARAIEQNARQPCRLAKMASRSGVFFVYISSAYVFDGKDGLYGPEDVPLPVNHYGMSKLEGEQRVLEVTHGRAGISRVIWLYGWERRRKNYGYQVLDALREGKQLVVDADQFGNPTFARDAALLQMKAVNDQRTGVLHLVNTPCCSRGEWTEALIRGFTLKGVSAHEAFKWNIVKSGEKSNRAPRPLNCCLKPNIFLCSNQADDDKSACSDMLGVDR